MKSAFEGCCLWIEMQLQCPWAAHSFSPFPAHLCVEALPLRYVNEKHKADICSLFTHLRCYYRSDCTKHTALSGSYLSLESPLFCSPAVSAVSELNKHKHTPVRMSPPLWSERDKQNVITNTKQVSTSLFIISTHTAEKGRTKIKREGGRPREREMKWKCFVEKRKLQQNSNLSHQFLSF